ncbi:DUF7344 domain-containing protein [Halegenticoccus soli]|uniref:DUF7344 domain-containing protein n=1 Tax=Halegenticoccus soli TaxID=1985678 RepID=UPI000C6E7658|nr:hypothetical protein [Halegenticoccus soli]
MSTAEPIDDAVEAGGAAGGRDADESAGERRERSERASDLSKDDLFHVLQNQRRRRVLKYLQGREGPVGMRDVAEQVAAWEHDTTVEALASDERQRVYIALYQSHLPKLDEKGIVDYNQSRGLVERTPLADQFDPYLEVGGANDGDGADGAALEPAKRTPTPKRFDPVGYYGGATALSLLLTGASWLGVVPAVVSSYLAAIILGMFALITAGALYRGR